MKFTLLRNVLFFLVVISFSGCADWRDALQGYPNPEQWSPDGGPQRPVPTVQDQGLLDARFKMKPLGVEAVPPLTSLERAASSLSDELVIHVLNIGAGSCQIVKCPHSHRVIVVDCGSSGASGSDLTEEGIAEYVQTHGIFSHLDTEVLITVSHPDQDHTNKIPTLLDGQAVQSIWLGGDYAEYTGPIGNFLDGADEAGAPIFHGWPPSFHNRGHPIDGLQCGAANTYILTANTEGSRNAQSMVLLLDYGDFRGIFAGDAEEATEEAAYQAYGALMEDTTVLLASHHGANTHGSNHDAWIAATNPQIVVFSAGDRYGHPRQEVVERYQNAQTSTVAPHHIRWGVSSTEYEEHLPTEKPVFATRENGRMVKKLKPLVSRELIPQA